MYPEGRLQARVEGALFADVSSGAAAAPVFGSGRSRAVLCAPQQGYSPDPDSGRYPIVND